MLIVLIMMFFACRQNDKKNTIQFMELDIDASDSIRRICTDKSLTIITKEELWRIQKQMDDSLLSWIDNELGRYKYFNNPNEYRFDTVFCFNNQGDKFVTSFFIQGDRKNGGMDDIERLYGVKIQSKWYFIGGSTLALPRQYFNKDILTPISFEMLERLAAHFVYRNYLINDGQGGLVINDDFFSDITSQAYCGNCTTQQQWDSAYIRSSRLKWLPNKR